MVQPLLQFLDCHVDGMEEVLDYLVVRHVRKVLAEKPIGLVARPSFGSRDRVL